jgi:SMC interacting uncharacterized protein involved in chromosome segregation
MSKIGGELNDFKFKIQQFTTENELLRKKLQEAGDVNLKVSELERRGRDLEFRNQSLEREKIENEGKARNLEQKLITLSAEIERINGLYNNVGK